MKSCPELEQPVNGKVMASTDVGGIAHYSCNDGFLPDGIPFRTCQANGTWTGEAISCDCKFENQSLWLLPCAYVVDRAYIVRRLVDLC